MLKNYQTEFKNLSKKNSKLKFTIDDLLTLEETIKNKDNELKQIQDEIKELTIVKRKQQKLIEKKERNEDGNKLTKLVEEVRKQK